MTLDYICNFCDVLKKILSVYIRIFVPSGSQPILGDPVRHHIVGCQNILRDLMGPHKLLRDLLVYDDCESLKVQVEYIYAYLLLCQCTRLCFCVQLFMRLVSASVCFSSYFCFWLLMNLCMYHCSMFMHAASRFTVLYCWNI